MANKYYSNTTNIILPGSSANASDVEDKCNDIVAGFDQVETDITDALQLTAADHTTRSLSQLAAVRANTNIGFDNNGDLTLNNLAGSYQGDWATSTYYKRGDTVKDSVGSYGSGVDALLVALTTHTSTTLVADAANWDVQINTANLEQAVTDAQAAEANASTSEANASTSETNAQLEAWNAEAEKMTADSYATEAEDVFVKVYTSNGDGTFTATTTTEYSALHWAAKANDGSVAAHLADLANPHQVTATQVGLGNVDNTADVDKPISSATQTALDGKVDDSQVLTNVPSGAVFTDTLTNETITLSGDVSGSGTSSIVVTVTDDSHNHVISNIDGLQITLDSKAPLASPALTGIPTAPTAIGGTNTTQIATTEFVLANSGGDPTTTQVLNATAGLSLGQVGSYAMCYYNVANTQPGSTYAATSLLYAGTDASGSTRTISSPTPSGTWRALGYAYLGGITIFVRIA